jgi:hypothetical protein
MLMAFGSFCAYNATSKEFACGESVSTAIETQLESLRMPYREQHRWKRAHLDYAELIALARCNYTEKSRGKASSDSASPPC